MQGPDASNSCLPASSPVIKTVPPVPMASRGERVNLDGRVGRYSKGKSVLAYTSGRSAVVRDLDGVEPLLAPDPTAPKGTVRTASQLPALVYRGHQHRVTAVKLSPSGCYASSGDERGMLRVWAFDHPDHLCKYDAAGLTGPIRDIDWDSESKRIVLGGERAGESRSADCARVLQWDTGVTVGQLQQYVKGRVGSVAFKPERPFRIATSGKDEPKCYFHKGPPFARVPPASGVPEENAHAKGGVNCLRFNSKGTVAVSVGSDRSVCLYDGKTFALKKRVENVHAATIYSVAWSHDDATIMTASGDGTCKLFDVAADGSDMTEKHVWKPAQFQNENKPYDKVPVGGIQLGCTFVNGTTPVTVGLNGQICVLPPPGSNQDDIRVVTGHYAAVDTFAVDYDRDRFYTGDTDGMLCVWKLSACEPIRRLHSGEGNADLMYVVHGGAVSGLAANPSTGALYSVGWDDKMYRTDKECNVGMSPVPLGAQPGAVSIGTDYGVVVTVRGLLVFDARTGELTSSSILSIPYEAHAACVSKDDRVVYVGGDDCKIHVYSLSDGALVESDTVDSAHLKPIHSFALSGDGKRLASADVRDVCVWDIAAGAGGALSSVIGKGRWCFHVQRVTSLAWSGDGQILASGGADDSIYLWNADNKNKRVHYKYAHRGGVSGLAFLPEEYKLISVGFDSVVNLWDVSADVKDKFGL